MHSVLLARGTNDPCSAGHALEAHCVRTCLLDLSRQTYNEYPVCAPHVSGVGSMRSAHVWHPSGVYIHASSSTHITFLCMHKNPDVHSERQRMHSVGPALDERVTNADGHPANDNALAKMVNFSVRGRASCICDWCIKPASHYKLIRRFRRSRRCCGSCCDFRLTTGTLRLADARAQTDN